jgi:hypothetical protein
VKEEGRRRKDMYKMRRRRRGVKDEDEKRR